jgi:hypothetical protein
LIFTKGDHFLVAEPGLNRQPPQSGGTVVMFVRHASNHPSKVLKQQPENGLALAQFPTQSSLGMSPLAHGNLTASILTDARTPSHAAQNFASRSCSKYRHPDKKPVSA